MKTFYFMIPHPDDEIIACSYWLKYVVDNHIQYKIFYFTDGENDFIGEMLSFCKDNCIKIGEMNLGISVKLMMKDKKINTVYIIYVLDENKKPVRNTRICVKTNDQSINVVTNELGWACIVLNGISKNIVIMLDDIEIPKSYIKPVTNEFHKKYGEMRYQESLSALEVLGIDKSNIERLQLGDGFLSRDNEDDMKLLKDKLVKFMDTTNDITFIIPHEEDFDVDHKAISSIMQSLVDHNQTMYKYLVHKSSNHKNWPNSEYISNRRDRLKSTRLCIPTELEDTSYISTELADVNLSKEKKLELIEMFQTQARADEYGFLIAFAKENEIYYK